MDKLIVALCILLSAYILVIMAILADLWSGLRKAKKMGVIRSSYGLRRTVDKISRYYNALIALSIVDALQMSVIWYLETYYNYCIPLLPAVTIIGAIGLCIIEIKSIYEKAEDKVRLEELGSVTGKIITHREDMQEVTKAIIDYLNSKSSSPIAVKVVSVEEKDKEEENKEDGRLQETNTTH